MVGLDSTASLSFFLFFLVEKLHGVFTSFNSRVYPGYFFVFNSLFWVNCLLTVECLPSGAGISSVFGLLHPVGNSCCRKVILIPVF